MWIFIQNNFATSARSTILYDEFEIDNFIKKILPHFQGPVTHDVVYCMQSGLVTVECIVDKSHLWWYIADTCYTYIPKGLCI